MNQETSKLTSPLEQVSPESLEDLFNKDPLELSEAEVMKMIMAFKKVMNPNVSLGDLEL
jgi:hypothetical protein